MHKLNSLCLIVFLVTINLFPQSESNLETVNDSITSLSNTDDVVDLFSISLSDDELNDDTSFSDNISGLLNSSMDIFYRTAAYEFSSSFFKVRGLDTCSIAFIFDGMFKGLGWMKDLRNVLLFSTIVVFIPALLLFDYYEFELYGIFYAFTLWIIARSIPLIIKFRKTFSILSQKV